MRCGTIPSSVLLARPKPVSSDRRHSSQIASREPVQPWRQSTSLARRYATLWLGGKLYVRQRSAPVRAPLTAPLLNRVLANDESERRNAEGVASLLTPVNLERRLS